MNATLNRLGQLEARFERMRLDLQDCQRKLTQALQQIRDGQAKYVPPNGSGANSVYWTQAPSGGIAAATGTWPEITPTTFAASIYIDSGGTLSLVASSQTVRWFYEDSAAANTLVPVEPAQDSGAWDAIGNSCTAV
jgi:type II secretory pathway pseudopilin PulG